MAANVEYFNRLSHQSQQQQQQQPPQYEQINDTSYLRPYACLAPHRHLSPGLQSQSSTYRASSLETVYDDIAITRTTRQPRRDDSATSGDLSSDYQGQYAEYSSIREQEVPSYTGHIVLAVVAMVCPLLGAVALALAVSAKSRASGSIKEDQKKLAARLGRASAVLSIIAIIASCTAVISALGIALYSQQIPSTMPDSTTSSTPFFSGSSTSSSTSAITLSSTSPCNSFDCVPSTSSSSAAAIINSPNMAISTTVSTSTTASSAITTATTAMSTSTITTTTTTTPTPSTTMTTSARCSSPQVTWNDTCFDYRISVAGDSSCVYGCRAVKPQFNYTYCIYDRRLPTSGGQCDAVGADSATDGYCYYTSSEACSCSRRFSNGICYPFAVPKGQTSCRFGSRVGDYCTYDRRYQEPYQCSGVGADLVRGNPSYCYHSSLSVCPFASNYIGNVCYTYGRLSSSDECRHGYYQSGFCYYTSRSSDTLCYDGDRHDNYCYFNQTS